MVNWAAPQNPCFEERDLYRWICTAGFVQLDVQMLYSIKYCVQAGIGWYRLDLPSVGPRGRSSCQPSLFARSLGSPARCPIGHDEGGRWPERRQAGRIPRTAWVIWGVSTFGARAARAKTRQVSARPVPRLVLRVSVCRTFRSVGLHRASLRAFLLPQARLGCG